MNEALAALPELLTAHLQLTVVAVLLGTVIAIPGGILAATRPGVGRVVTGVASVIQTIPGLALLALMVPGLAALGLQSIGRLPAAIGLVLYSLLPILRNTVAGLTTVDPAVREAARGVGMTASQQLWRVDLPLARPVMLAGIRTSVVTTVGMATLSTPVGAPSLGNLIFIGLQTRNLAFVLTGCLAAAALALALDGLVAVTARRLEDGRRAGWLWPATTVVGIVLLAVAPALRSLGGNAHLRSGPALAPVVIGAKPFTEQFILAELLAEHLRRKTGRPADLRTSLGSTVAYDGVRAGAIDAYVDYTGTLWTTILKRTDSPPDRTRVITTIGEALAATDRVHLIAALGFENAYCLAMRRTEAEALGIRSIRDLAAHAANLSIGGDYEFFGRQEWKSLVASYGLAMGQQLTMDPSLLFAAIDSGQVNVVSAYTTDPRLTSLDLVVLDDPLDAIPPYDAVLLVSDAFLRTRPSEVAALRELDGELDAATMRRLNLSVDQDGRTARAVAHEYLDQRR